MKRYNFFTILFTAILLLMSACHSVEVMEPSEPRGAINNVKARFVAEDGTQYGEFVGEIKEGSSEIVIPIPYFFPEDSNDEVTDAMLKDMKMLANLNDNSMITPSLTFMDMTKENKITVIDQKKNRKEYTIRAEIIKSSKAQILEFNLVSNGLSGIINETTKTISLATLEAGIGKADVKLSPHARISPDPREKDFNFDEDQKFVVTAFDGITSVEYTVKKEVPKKLAYGIRSGSAKLMFAKKLTDELGLPLNKTTGLALSGDHLLINTNGASSVYINAKTGEKVGMCDFSPYVNYYSTSDESGNILTNNLTSASSTTLQIVKKTSVTSAATEFITWDARGVVIGKKISVRGSLDANAIITAPITGTTVPSRFARWTVVGGVLTSQTPDIVNLDGRSWTTNADVIYSSDTDISSDYFQVGYPNGNTMSWINGKTNALHKKLDDMDSNFYPNAIDLIEFNNAKYSAINYVNGFAYGAADMVWLLNVTSDGDFSGSPLKNTSKAVVWETDKNKWGSRSFGTANPNSSGFSDVLLSQSDDGYFLYLYFVFSNGYVVAYQFDCIEM